MVIYGYFRLGRINACARSCFELTDKNAFSCFVVFSLDFVWRTCVIFLIEHFKIFLVISDDSLLINESIMPGIFKLSLISINPRLKAPCGEVPDLVHLMLSVWLRRVGVPYWLMVRRQKADARWIIAFLRKSKKVLISMLTSGLGVPQRSKRWTH